jgi:hypothetical protein
MARVYSFDVFDTCLARRSAIPSGVLTDVARKAFAKLKIVSSHPLEANFVAARIAAEHLARQLSSREEVTLDEIWKILTETMGWQENLAVCELEAEEESIVPILAIRKQVQDARQSSNGPAIFFDACLNGKRYSLHRSCIRETMF